MMGDLVFENIGVGDSTTALSKGPISTAHIMRWSSAMENWHRIHYDWRFATEHDKLPDVMVNGSWKQHVLMQMLNDWVGERGWVYRLSFKFQGMNTPGEVLTAWGRITEKQQRGAFGLAMLEVGIRNQRDEEGTPGTATVVLPLEGGPAVPYPFDPACLEPGWQGGEAR